MGIIEAKNLSHSYEYEGSPSRSIDGVTLTIKKGEWVVILGQNGSGKTTFVKHINALLPVQQGKLTVAGFDATNRDNVWNIRQKCGMVFQDPNNQFVSSIIEEDLSFGLENYAVPENEIPRHIKRALAIVGMEGFEKKSTHMLSGGQKQRIAIAGVLAINPDIIIFDEATAMLDPEGRQEVIGTIQRLHGEEEKTIIMISHLVEEAVLADRVLLFQEGRLIAEGTPRAILSDFDLLARAGQKPPLAIRAYHDLLAAGVHLSTIPLTNQALVEELCRLN